MLADTVFWERINFVKEVRFSEALFAAAVAKAGGQLCELDLSGWIVLSQAALLDAVNANSQTLHRLRLKNFMEWSFDHINQLCAAAPLLRELCAGVTCFAHESVRTLLRREPPFGVLYICRLTINFPRAEDENFFLSLASDLTLHGACLDELGLRTALLSSRAAWDALVDVAIAVHLDSLEVWNTPATLAGTEA